jgi:thioredoxin
LRNTEFQKRLAENRKPIIVDLWAPWCAPCRAMEPAINQISRKYSEQVDILRINADDSPEVLRSLRVMGIPTILGFAGGKEIVRRTGTQSVEALDVLFDATMHHRKPVIIPPAPIDRWIRSIAGFALIILSWATVHSIFLVVAGGILLFSAFYDRCPVYKAVFPRISAFFRQLKKSQAHPNDS